MSLIDGDKLQEFPIRANRCDKEHANEHFINGIETVLEYAEQLPTVDAEVVVRCKDCKWDRPDTLLDKHWCFRLLGCMEVRADNFCSYGERKDGSDADR